MAVAADFLRAPKFDERSSFLAGKIRSLEQASRTATIEDVTGTLLGQGTRYSADISTRLGSQAGAAPTLSQIETALGKNDISSLIESKGKFAAERVPQGFKLDDELFESLKDMQALDEKTLLERYAPRQVEFTEWLKKLTDEPYEYYKWLDEINAKPGSTFYKPEGGVSGMPGTKGTGQWGLQEGFANRLLALMKAASDAGHKVTVGEGWRSYETQVALKKKKPSLAATPGRSNHGWGLAADLQFGSAAARDWVHKNAARFGLRFPMSYEPWHIEPANIRTTSKTGVTYIEPKTSAKPTLTPTPARKPSRQLLR